VDASRRALDRLGFAETVVDRSAAFLDGGWVEKVRYGPPEAARRTEGRV
jgi:RimJ/RimL family protein N-acetyltransferase